MNQLKINYLKHDAIDTDKWDKCMEAAPNSLVYSQSWYLDKICEHWDALVIGDYQYVMPLIYRKKMGINYLYQSLYCQQLGIFPISTKEINQLFLAEINMYFSFAEINLNAMQLPVEGFGTHEERQTFLLSLNNSYEQIASKYSSHTKRKLKKAKKKNLSLVHSISIEEYFVFKKKNLRMKLSSKEINKLRNILTFALANSLGQIYGVYSNENELCTAAFFIRHKQRVTFLNASNSPEGKEHQAMYFLIDHFIQNNAEKDFLLDFEGSMVDGVARLYKGFGAISEKYHHYKWNNLPWWLKWFKK